MVPKYFLIGLVIWAVDDQSNFTVSPIAAPWIIGFVLCVSPPLSPCSERSRAPGY